MILFPEASIISSKFRSPIREEVKLRSCALILGSKDSKNLLDIENFEGFNVKKHALWNLSQ